MSDTKYRIAPASGCSASAPVSVGLAIVSLLMQVFIFRHLEGAICGKRW